MKLRALQAGGLTGVDLITNWVMRQIQPLKARDRPMWVYSGLTDPTRSSAQELSASDLKARLKNLTRERNDLLRVCPVASYDHPNLPEAETLSLHVSMPPLPKRNQSPDPEVEEVASDGDDPEEEDRDEPAQQTRKRGRDSVDCDSGHAQESAEAVTEEPAVKQARASPAGNVAEPPVRDVQPASSAPSPPPAARSTTVTPPAAAATSLAVNSALASVALAPPRRIKFGKLPTISRSQSDLGAPGGVIQPDPAADLVPGAQPTASPVAPTMTTLTGQPPAAPVEKTSQPATKLQLGDDDLGGVDVCSSKAVIVAGGTESRVGDVATRVGDRPADGSGSTAAVAAAEDVPSASAPPAPVVDPATLAPRRGW